MQINLPEKVARTLELPLEAPENIAPIAAAAAQLLALVNTKFDDGLGSIRAVAERMRHYLSLHHRTVEAFFVFFSTTFTRHVRPLPPATADPQRERFIEAKRRRGVAKLVGHDEIIPFLEHYEPLISALRGMEPRKHAQLVALYQTEMAAVFKREMTELLESIKSARLIRKAAEEKSYRMSDCRPPPLSPASLRLHEQCINGCHGRAHHQPCPAYVGRASLADL